MTVKILTGDVRERLAELAADSVDCVVTSPPYWGLRDYGVDGQIGMEPTLGEHLAVMVEVFEAVRRVLKPTGSLWLNYGDCYATAPNGRSAAETKAAGSDDRTFRDKPFSTVGPVSPGPVYDPEGGRNGGGWRGHDKGNATAPGGRVVAGGYLKPKDLCTLPNRLAIAMQDAGWWVRSEIVWGKPNAMPDSSGAYRPSTAHEKIFLLTKSGDGDVWRARDSGEISFAPDLTQRCPLATDPDRDAPRWSRLGAYYDAAAVKLTRQSEGMKWPAWAIGDEPRSAAEFNRGDRSARRGAKPPAVSPRHEGHINHTGLAEAPRGGGRLLRNFEQWEALAELVPPEVIAWEIAIRGFSGAHFATFPPALVVPCILAGCPAGGTVLDPFGGAGTTGMVAERLGREAILIELKSEYAELAKARLRAALCRIEGERAPAMASDAGPLFGGESLV